MVSADPRPIAVAAAILVRAGRVLLLAAADPAGPWDWPQGPVAPGEPLGAAALRVLAATAGVPATAVRPLLPQERIVRDPAGALRAHVVLFPVLCRWPAGEGAKEGEGPKQGEGPGAGSIAWWDPAAPAPSPLAPGVAALAAAALG
jgi:ADP-ribose pyrophosphatase YjhB (NUDIX family)